MDDAAPLRMDEQAWDKRIAALAGQACDADPEDETALLREALALLTVAPLAQSARFARLPGARRFEAMLAAGASESAALALLPVDAAWITSRGGNGCFLASVMIDGQDEDVAAEGATLALAVLAAMAAALRFGAPVTGGMTEAEPFGIQARPGCLH